MGVPRRSRTSLALGLFVLCASTTQACAEPKTCADKVERRFRQIDRDLSKNRDVSEQTIEEGLDDQRVVEALWDTIDDVLPVYESGGSYSSALAKAAKRNCERQGL